jgi:AAA15 family ATPase/GTPase
MIDKLVIKNFKSIKELDIDCRRINLFIGEPNTGKSNILDALAFLSCIGHDEKLKFNEFVRFESISDLFYDNVLEENINISIRTRDYISTDISFDFDNFHINIKAFEDGNLDSKPSDFHTRLDYSGDITEQRTTPFDSFNRQFEEFKLIKYYKFLKQSNFPGPYSHSLLPPYGSNLFAMAISNKEISERMDHFFEHLNLNIMLNSKERSFNLVKQKDKRLISYPYTTTSETLQRIIFYTIAMESNTNATLIFEEPESFAFPYYTKFLGERIAFDDKNQYFISTHNPYLLLAILEKAPKDSVYLFITYLEDYQTKLRQLTDKEILILMDSEPFFNLGYFLEEE